jgi:hypothetical protein
MCESELFTLIQIMLIKCTVYPRFRLLSIGNYTVIAYYSAHSLSGFSVTVYIMYYAYLLYGKHHFP